MAPLGVAPSPQVVRDKVGIRCYARTGPMKARRAVFFDRDGVLVEATVRDGRPFPPAGLQDIALVQGARDSVARLRDAGFVAICVTNQPDVARGSLDAASAFEMNKFVLEALGLDDLIACFHDDRDGCPCRKPLPVC